MQRFVELRFVCLLLMYRGELTLGDCLGPQMELLSDNSRRTCTKIDASKKRIEYSCTSLIKGFPKALIKYCPIEVCLDNGTWSKPSISCALSECYDEGKSMYYAGHRMCTQSGRHCQRWDTQEPQRHRFRKSEMFPDDSIRLAEAFCRDPEGNKGSPWCFTTDPDKKLELCDIAKCSDIVQLDGSCASTKPEKGADNQAPDESDEELNGSFETAVDNDKPQKADDKKKRYDNVDYLEFCSNNFEYKMTKDYGISGKVILETPTRSVVECASLCSHMPLCRFLTFQRENGICVLYGGKDYMLSMCKGCKTGIKSCHL